LLLSSTCIAVPPSYPHRWSFHFLSNLCTKSYTRSSQHIFCVCVQQACVIVVYFINL
jgi:hypothetical protein